MRVVAAALASLALAGCTSHAWTMASGTPEQKSRDAAECAQQADERFPLSPWLQGKNVAHVRYLEQRHDEAIDRCMRSRGYEREPRSGFVG